VYLIRIHAFINLGLLLGLLACTAAQAAPLRVTMLLAEEAGAYQEFAQAFAGEAQKQNISLNVLQSTSLPADTDLVVAVGIKSALIASKSRFPVLCVLISKAGFEKILGEIPSYREKNQLSAIYLDQPINRQVAMVAAAMPQAKNIGLLLSAHSPDVISLRKEIVEKKLGLRVQQLESVTTLYRDLESVLSESDVLLAIPDAEVYNSLTMRNILLMTYRSRVPVMGFSPAYVKAGALCAVFTTPSQNATQAMSLTKQFIESDILPAPQYPTDFDVLVNQQVARSLGIQIMDNTALVRQIRVASIAKGRAE
jgi:hypothetical protein